MERKIFKVRDHILRGLAAGDYVQGRRLPGARTLSRQLGIAFPTVQGAIASLVQDGLLVSYPRKGTLARSDWWSRTLSNGFYCTYWCPKRWWGDSFQVMFREKLPDVHSCPGSLAGTYEIRVMLQAQAAQADYMDLLELVPGLLDEKDTYFLKAFEPFMSGGKLFSIPFVFSPRVICFNPSLLRECGCPLPKPGWTWDDLIDMVRMLRDHLPPEQVFAWTPAINMWMCAVFRAGGALFSSDPENPVMIDHPNTRRGLRLWRELADLLGITGNFESGKGWSRRYRFADGKVAFQLAPRQVTSEYRHIGFDDWDTIPLPEVEGGCGATAQTTEVLCVRRSCSDVDQARRFIQTMLSEPVQDFMGEIGYGIPIRKSSAFKSFDFNDARDVLFLSEIPRMTGDYNIDSPELSELISEGVNQSWRTGGDMDVLLTKLAEAARTFLDIRKNSFGTPSTLGRSTSNQEMPL